MPVIPARAFRAISGAQPCPAILRQRGQEGFDLPLLPAEPDVCLARDRQHIRPGLGFQPQTPPPIILVDAVAGDPAGEHAGRERPLQHLLGQLRLGRKPTILRDPRLLTASGVVGPFFGQVEFAVQQSLAQPTSIAQKDPNRSIEFITIWVIRCLARKEAQAM